MRTGASFILNLDVTQRRSADANEGVKRAMSADCKLQTLFLKATERNNNRMSLIRFREIDAWVYQWV